MSIKDLISNAGGVESAFKKGTPVGTVVQGTILSADVQQVRDFRTGEPKTWDDGSAQQQLRIIVDTGQIDPSIPDDDGRRGIYVKWWGESRQALLAAVKNANDDDVRPGGRFGARLARMEPATQIGLSDTKIFEYFYEKPTTLSGFGDQPQQQAPQQPQQPQQQPQQQQGNPWGNQPPAQQQAPQQQGNPWGNQPPAQQQQAAEQAFQQGMDAQPVQQQAPQQQQQQAPQQQQQAPQQQGGQDDPVGKARQLLALGGFDDATIASSVGLPVEHVAAIRAGQA